MFCWPAPPPHLEHIVGIQQVSNKEEDVGLTSRGPLFSPGRSAVGFAVGHRFVPFLVLTHREA